MSASAARAQRPTRARRLSLRGVLRDARVGPWTRYATVLTVMTIILVLAGLLMSFSASIVDAAQDGDAFGVFRRQLLWLALGLPAFAVAANLDHRLWRRLAWPLIAFSALTLALVLVPGIGVERYGSQRWIGLGPLVFQPSEIAKLSLLLWVADVLERKRPAAGIVQTTEHLLVPALPAFGLLALLVMLQPDLGTTIILGLVVGAVLWVEGLPGRIFLVTMSTGALAALVLALVSPYRFDRLRGWWRPEDDPLGAGFQLLQSRFALGSGGLWGIGLGESRGKWNFIPNPETDFVFAIIGEELGLVGAVTVLVLFLVILYIGLHVAYVAPEGFGRTVAFGVTTWVVGQALINVGTVTGLLPITGVTLPLVSAGGTSLVTTLVSLGILVSVARAPRPVAREARR